MALMSAGAQAWAKGLETWGKMLGGVTARAGTDETERKDRRFAAPEWRENPIFDTIRQTYLRVSDQLLGTVDEIDGLDAPTREKLRFATRSFVDAMSPSNFALTNPQVLKRTLETRGENLLKGLANMLKDIAAGQVTQTKPGVFEVGRNLATTPGKVIRQTPLYQLIQYTPTTDAGAEDAGRDLPAVDQPLLHPRPHAREKLRQMVRRQRHQPVHGQLEVGRREHRRRNARRLCAATARSTRSTRSATCSTSKRPRDRLLRRGHDAGGHARLPSRQRSRPTRSSRRPSSPRRSISARPATSSCSLGDETMALLDQLTAEKGYLDGRYMAATFNLLRGRDLIWNYVVNNYLLGEEPPPFDLLHWNSDTTNLPAGWHRDYLETLYKGNKLAEKGGISVAGTPIDIDQVKTPTYIQAGREDHIAPPQSVWKIMDHFAGPKRFVLAGSGHIAGVVNPPAAQKYQYWVNEQPMRRRSTRSSRARPSTRAAGGRTGSNG